MSTALRALAFVLIASGLAGCRVRSSNGGGGQGYGGPPAPAGATPCTPSSVCLRVVPVAPGPPLAGRLAVVWAPVGDDDSTFVPELGYDGPFFGNERTVAIPYSGIALPRRTTLSPVCFDRRRPECNNVTLIATAYVVVLPDLNGNGRLDFPAELGKLEGSAVARVMIGHATQPIEPGGVLRDVFPAGVAGGFAPYAVSRPPGRPFDQMVLAPQGTWFDLVTCTTGLPRCDLSYPNLN